MTEGEVLSTITNYEKLVERAQEVGYRYACAIYGKQPYGLQSPSDLEVSMDQQHVWARWLTRGDYDSEEFPTSLPWGFEADLEAEVAAEKARRQARAQETARRMREEQESRDRAAYERLKSKFEPATSE